MTASDNTVFISYRRDVSGFIARAIFLDLRQHGYDVFMDVENIDSGEFGTIILNQIAARAHFVLILAPGTLARIDSTSDWLRREIEHAIMLKRNVVPILVNGFHFDDDAHRQLTGTLERLPDFNALNLPHDFFDAGMEKLRTRFLRQPASGDIRPTPADQQARVDDLIERAAEQSTSPHTAAERAQRIIDNVMRRSLPTGTPFWNKMRAPSHNDQGCALKNKDDLPGAIKAFSEAIRLDPQNHFWYFNRAIVRHETGDYDSAIEDYTMALRLDPQDAAAYNGRGWTKAHMGDLEGGVADCDRALALDPAHTEAYHSRGWASERLGDYEQALADYDAALELNPDHEDAQRDRANLLKKLGRSE